MACRQDVQEVQVQTGIAMAMAIRPSGHMAIAMATAAATNGVRAWMGLGRAMSNHGSPGDSGEGHKG